MPVSIISPAKNGICGIVSSFNISTDGICLQTELPLVLKERVELEIPTSVGKLKLKAEVIWNREDLHGCKFVDVDPKTHLLLSQWLYPPFEP